MTSFNKLFLTIVVTILAFTTVLAPLITSSYLTNSFNSVIDIH